MDTSGFPLSILQVYHLGKRTRQKEHWLTASLSGVENNSDSNIENAPETIVESWSGAQLRNNIPTSD